MDRTLLEHDEKDTQIYQSLIGNVVVAKFVKICLKNIPSKDILSCVDSLNIGIGGVHIPTNYSNRL